MKALLLAAVIVLLPFASKAVSSGDLVGQIVDLETRQPVPYAEVTFENYYDKITVKANEHGFYYGDHIPEGRYQMRVTYNHRTFVMRRVKVYDSYTAEVNFLVSKNDSLPQVVLEATPDPLIKAYIPHDILVTGTDMGSATMSFSDLMMAQPGMNIYDGKLYAKGAEIKIYIDGTAVLAKPVLMK